MVCSINYVNVVEYLNSFLVIVCWPLITCWLCWRVPILSKDDYSGPPSLFLTMSMICLPCSFLVVLYEYSQLDVFFVLGVVFAPAAGRLHDLGASLAAFTDVVLAVRLLGAVRLHQQGGADRAGQGVPQYGQRPVEVLGSRCEGHPVTLRYFTCQVWAVSGSPWRTTRAVET